MRVTLLGQPRRRFRDLSEFSVYGRPATGRAAAATVTPTATPTPTAPPRPAPTATPGPSLAARASRCRHRASGRSASKVTLRRALPRDREPDRRPPDGAPAGLGRKLTAATLTRNLKAGTTTITLKLSSAAARALQRGKPRSFRARLKVTATYAGAKPVSRSRQLTLKR